MPQSERQNRTPHYSTPRVTAFSLIELLTVITILGVLTAIAVPGFRQHLQSARRAEATGALLQIAVRQEQFMLQHRRYAAAAELSLHPPDGLGFNSRMIKHYDISIGSHATGYLASAQVRVSGAQNSDSRCRSFFIDATGAQTALDQQGATTTGHCWK